MIKLTQNEKNLLKVLCQLIIWILKSNLINLNTLGSFLQTLPKDILRMVVATRYLGQPGTYPNIEEAIEDVSNPSRFSDADLMRKIVDIIPDTLIHQLENGAKKI